MRSLIQIGLFCLLVGMSLQLYTASSKVIQLKASNFNEKVVKSPGIWMVEFYAPWCGHCKSLAPEWEKAAQALEGIVNIAAVDMTTEQGAGAPYNIQGFPTIKLFGLNKQSPVDYNGGRDAKAIINFALEQAKSAVNSRINGGASSGSKSSSSSSSGSAGSSAGSDEVVVLTQSNFASQVYNSQVVWIVEYYAPWCGHCKKLQPEWEAAARKLKGAVKLGKVNCDEESALCREFSVQGYPTLKYFKPASTGVSSAEEYQGSREEAGIVQYGMDLFSRYGGELEVKQITGQDSLTKECLESGKNACLIFFLPHILDSSVDQRLKTLKTVQTVMKDFLSLPLVFLWSQGGDQFDFEQQFPLGTGFPALLTIAPMKKLYSVMRTGAGFEASHIKSYISRMLAGQEGMYNLPQVLQPLRKVTPWENPTAKK